MNKQLSYLFKLLSSLFITRFFPPSNCLHLFLFSSLSEAFLCMFLGRWYLHFFGSCWSLSVTLLFGLHLWGYSRNSSSESIVCWPYAERLAFHLNSSMLIWFPFFSVFYLFVGTLLYYSPAFYAFFCPLLQTESISYCWRFAILPDVGFFRENSTSEICVKKTKFCILKFVLGSLQFCSWTWAMAVAGYRSRLLFPCVSSLFLWF
jgi:hypothetical protein